ncbi:MAG: hypothetical protein ACK5WW_02835 [Brevundimonas sp.]|uniref:hypothetical protein n=1 Tax=Brevundimonas sp. TaxID=1871086 RepID=UPI0022CAFFFB|nr:hypothetical protein [Brevundimonas sp.]MCZ8086495.1 hypothetical protein [Brevundimonas sp.]MCZ8194562.1 hypothetical protein [Brevundimonas sp.]
MKRLDANQLLALSTGLALIVLVLAAAINAPEGKPLRYPVLGVVCSVAYVVLSAFWTRRTGVRRPPMIHPDTPGAAVWSSLFPLGILIAAAVPFLFPGLDFGLLVIIGAIFFGVTMESAIKAARMGGR